MVPDHIITLVVYMMIYMTNTIRYTIIEVDDTEEDEILFSLQAYSIVIWIIVFSISLNTYYSY